MMEEILEDIRSLQGKMSDYLFNNVSSQQFHYDETMKLHDDETRIITMMQTLNVMVSQTTETEY